MKQARFFITMALSVLAVPVGIAQDNNLHSAKHYRYKLIDMGTFGGPNSYFTNITPGRSLNNSGVATGSADTFMAVNPPSVSTIASLFTPSSGKKVS